MNGKGWAALVILIAAGGLLLVQVFQTPTDLVRPRNAVNLIFNASYILLASLVFVVPVLLVRHFADKRLLQTMGLAAGLWAVLLAATMVLVWISVGAQGRTSLAAKPALLSEYVLLCFAAAGILLFLDHLLSGRLARVAARARAPSREAMRARR